MEKGKKVHNFAFGYDFSEEFLKDKCKSLYSWVFSDLIEFCFFYV